MHTILYEEVIFLSVDNLNLLFNKTYYLEIGQPDFVSSIAKKNEKIFKTEFDADRDYLKLDERIATERILMKTAYPGLMIGTGYTHGSGIEGANDDINVGFSLDYVSGQPYIPSSSVKGVLRSAFKHEDFIKGILGKDNLDVSKLEKNIFGDNADKTEGEDQFFDAVIRYSVRNDKRILGDDYITPHNNIIKNPIPILMMKVLPDVVFEFRFKLSDIEIGEITITAEDKKHLFTKILSVLGVGAKTNVGYGNLIEYKE